MINHSRSELRTMLSMLQEISKFISDDQRVCTEYIHSCINSTYAIMQIQLGAYQIRNETEL